MVALGAGTASAVELRDAELVAGGSPVLQNGTGKLRLEDGRLGRPGLSSILVPEPGALWQQAFAIGLLAVLAGRRRRTACQTPAGATRPCGSRHFQKEDIVMKKHFRSRAPWLATLVLTLLTAPTLAQVPPRT